MRLFGQRRITIGFTVGIIFLLFTTLGTVVLANQYQQTIADLRHYESLQTTISDLLSDILNAETGQRGYVITGNISYLAPYYKGLSTIDQTNASLKSLSAGNANLTTGYQELQPIMAAKLSELNETIFVRSTQGFAAAQAIVNSSIGEVYTNEIRAITGAMSAYVSQQEANDVSLSNSQESERLDGTYFDTVVALGVIGFAIYWVRRNLINEEKARQEAQLLQDILTHDIRNYNQITRLSAELLQSMNKDPESAQIVSTILQSIDGSTQLVDRAKKLGKILSEENVKLFPVDLVSAIENSMKLAKSANKDLGKTIVDQLQLASGVKNNPQVLADSLLEEVFVNLYSNSVKYTETQIVNIETLIEDDQNYWKVSVSDSGKGISDDRKSSVFSRYMKSSSGSGLGLSIVYALVVQRYNGRIKVRDRVERDFRKGTTVVFWLKKAG
jgi:signal transduction histidine kinase